MKKVLLRVESDNGHDDILVPKDQLPEKVEEQLKDNKWVTLEKKDGSTDILTKTDTKTVAEEEELSDEDKKLQEELGKKDAWKNAFKPASPAKSNMPAPAPASSTTKGKTPYEKKFEGVISATATSKAKGG